MLEVRRLMLEELISQDTLLILAKGMGLFEVLSSFLMLYSHKKCMVLVVNADKDIQARIELVLRAEGCEVPPRCINNEFTPEERSEVYKGGGCICITSRILTVDLLNKRVPVTDITGIVVWDAHRVDSLSSEAFILRLFRESNKEGFIKGLSDCPESFGSGHFKVESVMKLLFVKKLSLWPRFEMRVIAALAKHPVDLVELEQEVSSSMSALQSDIIECMDACLVEIRKSNQIDVTELTLEGALVKSFDQIVRRQLQTQWHKVGHKTKQLVEDLKTLRKLLTCLITHDCVAFLNLLETLRATSHSEHTNSNALPFWLMTGAAERLFRHAKERVFRVVSNNNYNTSKNKSDASGRGVKNKKLEVVLEANPKWTLLASVLDEIRGMRAELIAGGTPEYDIGGTLIVVRDDRTASRARDVLCYGVDSCLRHAFKRFCSKKREGYNALMKRGTYRQQQSEGGDEGGAMTAAQVELQLLVEEGARGGVGRQSSSAWDDLVGHSLSTIRGWVQADVHALVDYLTRSGGADGSVVTMVEDSSTANELQGLATKGVIEAFAAAHDMYMEHGGFAEFEAQWDAPLPRGVRLVVDVHIRGCAQSVSTEEMLAHVRGLYEDAVRLLFGSTALLRHTGAGAGGGGGTAGGKRKAAIAAGGRGLRGEDDTDDDDEDDARGSKMDSCMGSGVGGHASSGYSDKAHDSGSNGNSKANDSGSGDNVINNKDNNASSAGAANSKGSSSSSNHGSRGKTNEAGPGKDKDSAKGKGKDNEKDKNNNKRRRGASGVGLDAVQHGSIEDPSANTRRTLKLATDTEIVFSEVSSDVQPLYESRGGMDEHVDVKVWEALPQDSIVVHTLDNLSYILAQVRPSVVVLFDPDIAATRTIEVYRADNPGTPLRVYFLSYSQSVEEQRYLSDIRRETEAFEQLIDTKARMVIDSTQDGRTGQIVSVAPDAPVPASSRKGGAAAKRRIRVVVDVREFRSALPSLLHKKGMEVVPVTLEVGDYVLSPNICVERKSISDLYSSFASGRLYQQVEAMVRFYRTAVLLIEFDESRAFSFQSISSIGSEISAGSIISKLCLLSLHFPSLKIMWMRNPHNTADMFDTIKQNQEEPVAAVAEKVGLNECEAKSAFNIVPQDVLRKLPGVTPHNVTYIMNHVESLSELSKQPLKKLQELMGDANGAQLHAFLNARSPASLANQ